MSRYEGRSDERGARARDDQAVNGEAVNGEGVRILRVESRFTCSCGATAIV